LWVRAILTLADAKDQARTTLLLRAVACRLRMRLTAARLPGGG
jgi:hypothetical protein